MKILARLVWIVCAIACSAIAQSSVPPGMTYQGRLIDANSTPVPDGTGYEIEVRLWNASTGGNLLWGTRYTGVPLKNGAFNLILGSGGTSISGASTTDLKAAFSTSTVYLGLTATKNAAGAAIPSPTEILPRQQLLASPYAFRAEIAATTISVQSDGVLSTSIKDGEVKTADIANGAVTTEKIADASVTGAKVALASLGGSHFSLAGIPVDRIALDFASISEQQPSGTNGGVAVAGWRKRPLNSIISSGPSISLNSETNAITLTSGTYQIQGSTSCNNVAHTAVLRPQGSETIVLKGSIEYGQVERTTNSILSGILVVATPIETFELWDHISSVFRSSVWNLGTPSSLAAPEKFSELTITRLK